MDVWTWLTSQGLPVLVAIVGIVSGVVGGVASQLVAGYFKTRGDMRQLTATREQFEALQRRWEEEQEFERYKLLAEERRKLFIQTAHALQRMREVLKADRSSQGEGWRAWQEQVTRRANELFMLETELRILAPELAPRVQAATNTARLIRAAPPEIQRTELDELVLKIRTQADEVMTHMRKLLGTETHRGGVLMPNEK